VAREEPHQPARHGHTPPQIAEVSVVDASLDPALFYKTL
jgi:hypothetical protein